MAALTYWIAFHNYLINGTPSRLLRLSSELPLCSESKATEKGVLDSWVGICSCAVLTPSNRPSFNIQRCRSVAVVAHWR